jgi:hypothetical protein
MMGIFAFAQQLAPVPGGAPGVAAPHPVRDVGPRWRFAGWGVEAAALAALFLLVQGRGGAWWMDGLVSAWVAWIFRGPVFVLTVAAWSRLPTGLWWQLSLRWFLLYSLCGITLAFVARRTGVRREGGKGDRE